MSCTSNREVRRYPRQGRVGKRRVGERSGMNFVRFEAAEPNARGAHSGIFGLANDLAFRNVLSDADREWLRQQNVWGDAAYPDPERAICQDSSR